MGKIGVAPLQLAGRRSQIEAETHLAPQEPVFQERRLNSLIPKAEMGKPELFQYMEYRAFLTDYVEWRQKGNASFSKRAFSQKYFGSTGILYAVIQGQRDLGPKLRVRCAAALALEDKENEYFDLLVQHNQAKADLERNFLFEKLSRFRNS